MAHPFARRNSIRSRKYASEHFSFPQRHGTQTKSGDSRSQNRRNAPMSSTVSFAPHCAQFIFSPAKRDRADRNAGECRPPRKYRYPCPFRFRPKAEEIVASAADEAEKPRQPGQRRPRRVWVQNEAGKLEPVVVEDGISDDSFTEIKGPASLEGREVVLGYETPSLPSQTGAGGQTNPFMPKPPQRNKNRGTAPSPKG